MPTITAPEIEVTKVVTGFMYQLLIAEEQGGSGITRIDIGPYRFPGVAPRIRYPEAVTNELAPPSWQPIRWITDSHGQSWLRYDGGTLLPEDGEEVFQFTSSFSASDSAGPRLVVWRGQRSETFDVPIPDYTQPAPLRNSRHDSQGRGLLYQTGCAPQIVLTSLVAVAAAMVLRALL